MQIMKLEAYYEAISKFKDRQLKQLNKKLEKLENKIQKLTGQNII